MFDKDAEVKVRVYLCFRASIVKSVLILVVSNSNIY